jgi:Protein of unknown function (DUF3592)
MFKAILLAFIGLVWTVFAVGSMLDGKALASRGKTTQIQPMEKIVQTTRKKWNQADRVSYEGEVQFTTEAGQTVSVKKSLSRELTNRIIQEQAVQVRYLPDKPTTARLEDEKGATGVDISVGVAILLVGGLWFRKKLYEKPRFND